MKRLELRDILDERVGWKQPTTSDFTISAANLVSEGGRYFQDEHSFVKIVTIHSIMDEVTADDVNLNVYLSDLRKQVTLLVIDEVFADSDFNTVVLTSQEDLFDAAISKRMAIKVAEILFSTSRSNRIERISKEARQQFFFDINGDKNFPNKVGILDLYNKEVKYLRDIFNTGDALDVVSLTANTYENDALTYE